MRRCGVNPRNLEVPRNLADSVLTCRETCAGERGGAKAPAGAGASDTASAAAGGAGGKAVVASLLRASAVGGGGKGGAATGDDALVLPASTHTQLKAAVTNALKIHGGERVGGCGMLCATQT